MIFTPMFIADLVNGNYKDVSDTAEVELAGIIGGGICAGLIPGILSVLLVVRLIRLNRREKEELDVLIQDRILEFAVASGGKITAVELATHLDITTSHAQSRLEHFVSLGLARLQVSESGVLVYHFDQIISRDEKNRAETV